MTRALFQLMQILFGKEGDDQLKNYKKKNRRFRLHKQYPPSKGKKKGAPNLTYEGIVQLKVSLEKSKVKV